MEVIAGDLFAPAEVLARNRVRAGDDHHVPVAFQADELAAVRREAAEHPVGAQALRPAIHLHGFFPLDRVLFAPEDALRAADGHRLFAGLHDGHRGVDRLEESQRLAGDVEVERAGLPLPAIDAEGHRDVVHQPRAVVADLGGDDLDAVARRHAHAALRVRLFRLRVELRLRAGELVREAVLAIEDQPDALERGPAGFERHDAVRADARDDASADRLHVVERLELGQRRVLAANGRGDGLVRDAALPDRLVPVDDDESDERDEDDRQRDAEDTDRALHVFAA
jgi:hypothetical protein